MTTIDAKEQLLQTVIKMMKNTKDINKITNRQIAAEADVNSALINYYFQSKDNLLLEAVNTHMENLYKDIMESISNESNPVTRLKSMLMKFLELGISQYKFVKIPVSEEMKTGGITTNKMIQQTLKEIYKEDKSDFELQILASQILLPLQTIYLHIDEYKNYLDVTLDNTQILHQLVDSIFTNLNINE
ncbi:TetR/AcrR family transcriptional regulator [Breznakia pachnodae]|uniref:AcrR family transcriptional regulator n=1 Tax=Breznakia pachnodae TaxID=265178 RepID=A0ABU0E4Z8_9FIRM|nr:TetR/AcrR family transcriptional regulator [Breznakia pachnodae]MDQ0361982.1 AcrR family transcriptional regulator [Breznakia pachnodae]